MGYVPFDVHQSSRSVCKLSPILDFPKGFLPFRAKLGRGLDDEDEENAAEVVFERTDVASVPSSCSPSSGDLRFGADVEEP